ncbi:MAG: tetratricopeptide repeat protein [Pseudomonadota bacterium]
MRFGDRRYSVLVVALALIGVSGCGGKEQRQQAHLEKSKDFLAQTDYAKAGVEIRNVLQIEPKNIEAYYIAGLIEEKLKNYEKAFSNYSKALELDPNYNDAKVRLGRIYIFMGDSAKAEKLAAEILATAPSDAAAKTLRAAVMVSKGDKAQALKIARDVLAHDPHQTDAITLLAGLYSERNEDQKAREVLEQGITADPKNISLRLVDIAISQKMKDNDHVERQYQAIIEIAPKQRDSRVALAAFYVSKNELDKAEQTLRGAIKADVEDDQRYLLLSEFLARTKGGEVAEKELLAALQNRPNAHVLRFGLAFLYAALDRKADAEKTFRSIVALDKNGADGIKARDYLAQARLDAGAVSEAEQLIVEVLAANPRDNQALLLRAKMSIAKGNAVNAIPDLRAVLKDQPDSAILIAMLVKAHLQNKEQPLAKEVAANAIAQYPNDPRMHLAMADYYAAVGEHDAALTETAKAIQLAPDSMEAIEKKGELAARKKDWRSAESAMEKLQAKAPDHPRGYYLLGQVYLAQGKLDRAQSQFEAALKKGPNSIEPLASLVTILLTQGKADQALERVQRVRAQVADNALLNLMQGEIYSSQKKYREAIGALGVAIRMQPTLAMAYIDLSKVHALNGDGPAALQALEDGLKALPQDEYLALELANIYQARSDYNKAIAIYEDILKKSPGNDVAANNLAALLTDTKGDPPSLERALALTKRFEASQNPLYTDSAGWVYYKLGQYDRAIPLLRQAAKTAPTVAVLNYHLGMALYKKGDVAAAKIHLKKALDTKREFIGIQEAKEILARG